MTINNINIHSNPEWHAPIRTILAAGLQWIRSMARPNEEVDIKLINELADLCHDLPRILAEPDRNSFAPSVVVGMILIIGSRTSERRNIRNTLIRQLPEPYQSSARQQAASDDEKTHVNQVATKPHT